MLPHRHQDGYMHSARRMKFIRKDCAWCTEPQDVPKVSLNSLLSFSHFTTLVFAIQLLLCVSCKYIITHQVCI